MLVLNLFSFKEKNEKLTDHTEGGFYLPFCVPAGTSPLLTLPRLLLCAPPCPEPGLLPAGKDLTQKVTLLEVLRKQRLQLIRTNQEMSGQGEGSLSRGRG